jgi:ABC-type lipoprotein release transport system permease subunit
MVIGLDTLRAPLPFRLAWGSALAAGDPGHVIVGDSLARRLGIAGTSDEMVDVRVLLGPGRTLTDDVGRYRMAVAGVAQVSFVSPEGIVVDRTFLAGELGQPAAASLILLHRFDHASARTEARRIAAEFPEVEALAWMDDAPFLANALEGSAAVSAISQVMVIFAVLIPVWALLHLHVVHRQRDLGLMGALGFRRAEVFSVFLLQALVVAVIGIGAGSLGGLALIEYFRAHPVFHSGSFVIRPLVTVAAFVRPAATALLATLAAGAIPAAMAARRAPAPILRAIE